MSRSTDQAIASVPRTPAIRDSQVSAADRTMAANAFDRIDQDTTPVTRWSQQLRFTEEDP